MSPLRHCFFRARVRPRTLVARSVITQEITIAFKGGVGMKKIMRAFAKLELL